MTVLLKILVIVTIIIGFIGYKINKLLQPPELPIIEETWWGHGDPAHQDKSIRNFEIKVADKEIEDLKYRLNHTREFVPPLEGIQHQYGMNTNLLKKIVLFWQNKYDWKSRQQFLNKFPQFKTNIQGLDIHFIHVKPKDSNLKVLPLLMLHGWPGSVREFYDVIPMLTTPQKNRDFVFEVIVPSLPGYGFSDPAIRPGLGAAQAAVIFKNLMKRLNFDEFYAQGGDFGAIILQHLAVLYPKSVKGFHNNMCTAYTPLAYLKTLLGVIYPTWFTRKEHIDRVYPISKRFAFMVQESGYFHIQATKPDTIGVSLRDSPVGLAAYILEKFVTGLNASNQNIEDGGLTDAWSYTDLLDNVMIYWFTGSMPTAIRLYSETFSKKHFALGITRNPVLVPSACARFANDFYSSDGILSDIYHNLLHLADHNGGHFAAFQVPKVFTEDVFTAVQKFEQYHQIKTLKKV